MKILALDASGIVATVAIASEEEIIAEYTIKHKKTHSQTLLPMIDEVMKFTELNMNDIDYIAATNGPGSFTGLRIGAATAKGLAQAINIPIVSIPTLEALAYNVNYTEKLICPIIDARRNNVFTGIYKRQGNSLDIVKKQCAISIEELVEKINKIGQEVIFVGDGVSVWQEYIQKNILVDYELAPVYMREQKASSVIGLAMEYIKENKYVKSKDFQLDYLRKSQAERELEKKNK
jgi:tRNA threonylcarbamoyladenosine biosynthesis protein TsaB